MRALVVSDNLASQVNGVAITLNKIQELAKVFMPDYAELRLLTPDGFRNISAYGYPEVKLTVQPLKVLREISSYKPTHIHIATEGPLGLLTRLYCSKKGWKFTTSYHTQFPMFLEKMYGIPSGITWKYLRWFHSKAENTLVPTESIRLQLRDQKFDGSLVLWSRGVDKAQFISNKKPVKNRVLYVGRVSKEKNLEDLCALGSKYDIHIVGDGPERKILEQKYSDVNFVGYKKGQELADEYASAEVFCFPSRSDTFGIVLIESLALGTPVAAYPVPGPRDIVKVNKTGYLSNNLEEAIEKCKALGRVSGPEWSWEKCYSTFMESLTHV